MIQKLLYKRQFFIGSLGVLLTIISSLIILLFENSVGEYINLIIPDLFLCETALILIMINGADIRLYFAFLVIHHIGIITHCILGTNMFKLFVFDFLGILFASLSVFFVEFLRTKRHCNLRFFLILFSVLDFLVIVILVVFGTRVGGTKAWISLFGVSLQLSEFLKLSFLFYVAFLFGSQLSDSQKHLFLSLFTMMNIVGLAILNEFGTAIVILIVYLCVTFLFCSTRSFIISLMATVALISTLVVFDLLISNYVNSTNQPIALIQQIYDSIIVKLNHRFLLWVSPSSLDYDSTYQMIKSREAVTQGGFLGSISQNPVYVPIQSSDFIFTAIIENLGLITGFAVVAVFFYITVKLLRESNLVKNDFDSVCISVSTLFITVTSIIMILGSTGAFVLTGVPIAFLSEGGTQTIIHFSFAAIAMSFCNDERISRAIAKRSINRIHFYQSQHKKKHKGGILHEKKRKSENKA